jgi:1,4-dihydroxy-6-naphthoate synthase
MELTIGFSTCPNDTFMFDALVNHKIDTKGLTFNVILADIEELNRLAFKREIDVCKLSYHAYSYVANDYAILNAGSALGRKNGPLLIARKDKNVTDYLKLKVAIPGEYTTAHLLLKYLYPEIKHKEVNLFSDIENAVIEGIVDAGVIIHENRFTYQQKGLVKLADLGEEWEEQTGLPIPLGCIGINRKLPKEIQKILDNALLESVQYAYKHPDSSNDFVKKHAQELEADVIRKHIELYVNQFSVALGDEGKQNIRSFFRKMVEKDLVPDCGEDLFV